MRKIIFILGLLFVFGCQETPYLKENSAFVVFKTPTFKYADMGFIYQNPHKTKLQIYANGQSVMSLTISSNSVCMSALECMSKDSFNKEVLSSSYPSEILADILQAKPIFSQKYVKYTQQGFTQYIKKENSYNIKYKVSKKRVEFRDDLNHIIIKIIKDI